MLFHYALNFFCALYSCTIEQPILVDSKQVNGVSYEHYYLQTQPDVSGGYQDNVIEDNPTVWIPDGGLRGFNMETVSGKKILAFQGIPFAAPPTGNLRFQAPVKNSPWKGVKDAIATSPICIQADFFQLYKQVGEEDCLFLNVYAHKVPKRGVDYRLPVLVGIHQGGFFFGSNNLLGPAYLMDEPVVMVVMNYRLGALGFLSTGDQASPGNNGLKDQALALKWVQENIGFFGGDPNRVTIFGESAGAGSVSLHMLSRLSRGLFSSGISQSGCAFCFWSIGENAPSMAKKLATAVNCSTENSFQMVECLRGVNASQIVGSQIQQLEWASYPVALFTPVIEQASAGAFLDDLPENLYKKPNGVAKVPWITGINSDELSVNLAAILLNPQFLKEFNEEWETKVGPVMFELTNSSTSNPAETLRRIRNHYMGDEPLTFENRKKALRMLDDRYLVTCGHKAIRYHAQLSEMPVYAYYLKYPGKYSVVQLLGQKPEDWGVAHIDDLIYLANNTAYYPMLKLNDTEYKISRMMTNLWANFAAYGIPFLSSQGGQQQQHIWQPISRHTASDLQFLEINTVTKMISDPFKERIRFWENLKLREGDFYDPTFNHY